MTWQCFRALDDDWTRLTQTEVATCALGRWSSDPILERFADLGEIITALRAGTKDPAGADQILVALAARAPHDDVAARTMLQALIPGLINVAKRLGRGIVDSDLEAQVLTEAFDRIRNYPLARRPRAVAANITLDVLGRITRQRAKTALVVLVEDVAHLGPQSEPDPDPSDEVAALIADALACGQVRGVDARLLTAIAVGHDTIGRRAEREGVSYDAMNERWRRARNRLRAAIAA